MAKVYTDRNGYKRFMDSGKLVHRYVAEKIVGGWIFPGKVVHHIDGDRGNFRPSNLRIMSRRRHSKLHSRRW